MSDDSHILEVAGYRAIARRHDRQWGHAIDVEVQHSNGTVLGVVTYACSPEFVGFEYFQALTTEQLLTIATERLQAEIADYFKPWKTGVHIYAKFNSSAQLNSEGSMTLHTPTDDPCMVSVATFDKLADRYAEKYFGLRDYDRYYQMLADNLPEEKASIIDIACGPGNVAAYFARVRPEVSVVGVDLAQGMVKQARARVPTAEFHMLDCRALQQLNRTFQGAAFAFWLSYLTVSDVEHFFISLKQVLIPGSVLLLTMITGTSAREGYEASSSGERVYMVYRTPLEVRSLLASYGYSIEFEEIMTSPANASVQTNDMILLARYS
ncbi:MAG: class I SAM-dependent methyltransferase [Gallionellaceae bacterium]